MNNWKIMRNIVLVGLLLMNSSCENKKVCIVDEETTQEEIISKDLGIMFSRFYESLNYLNSEERSGERYHFPNLIDGLVEVDKFNRIVPSLATSWDVRTEDDITVWTFNIREGVEWQVNSDLTSYGEYVTANDWVTSAKYILNPNSESPYFDTLGLYLTGASNYYCSMLVLQSDKESEQPECANEEDYEYNIDFESVGVRAIDDYTLEYRLKKSSPYFLPALMSNEFYPVNEKFLGEQGEDFAIDEDHLLINGAYSIHLNLKDYQIE